jgi:hypothetical protein
VGAQVGEVGGRSGHEDISIGESLSNRWSSARGTREAASGESGSGQDGEDGRAAVSADGRKCPQVGEGGSVHWRSFGEAVRAGEGGVERARFVRASDGRAAWGDPSSGSRGDLELVPAEKALRRARSRRFAETESAGRGVGVRARWSPKTKGAGLCSAMD